jgi:ectoine hydroxylase-related dioxygenase (phytanoyl-CoA dioxygenase family)
LQLHPENRGFEWPSPSAAPRLLTAQQLDLWQSQGCFVLEGAVDRDTLDRLVAEIDPWERKAEAALRERHEGRRFINRAGEITFTVHLVKRSAFVRRFCASALFQDLGHDLLGPDVRLYWDQAVYKKPGTEAPFPWHQDNGYGFVDPQCYLTCWIALNDATEQNGCPWVVPGLHRLGTLVHETTDLGFQCVKEPPDAFAVPAHAGDIVVFSSLTPHATGPNLSGGVRKAYIVQLAPDGAVRLQPGPDGALRRVLQDDPERQFMLLRDGAAVDGASLSTQGDGREV